MYNIERFGIPMPEFRTDYGTLKSRELENIITFLNKRGILITNCFDRKALIVNPYLTNNIRAELLKNNFRELLIGATLSNIRNATQLNLAQNRVLEALTPGSLIVKRDPDISVALPDDPDLRNLCAAYGGTLHLFITNSSIKENELIDSICSMELADFNKNAFGVLEYPYYDEQIQDIMPTVVSIKGLKDFEVFAEGCINKTLIEQAANQMSKYEIGEW